MTPAEDLRALEIDRADLRWEAACGYIEEQRQVAEREFNRVAVTVIAGGLAMESAAFRDGWPILGDVLCAVAHVRKIYGDKAAAVVSERLVPAELRRVG